MDTGATVKGPDSAPPPYSGDQQFPQAPPPAYSASGQQGSPVNQMVYWLFWGVLFASLVTWVFAVVAAADDKWITPFGIALDEAESCDEYSSSSFYGYSRGNSSDICSILTAARAMQYMATILVSIELVVVIVAASMRAPLTGKLGLAAGIMLVVFSVLQLIAFSLMAACVRKFNDFWGYDFRAGATLGVAVVAWILGTAGAIVVLVLRTRATTDQDGPFTKCMPPAGGAKPGAPPPAAQPAYPTANV